MLFAHSRRPRSSSLRSLVGATVAREDASGRQCDGPSFALSTLMYPFVLPASPEEGEEAHQCSLVMVVK